MTIDSVRGGRTRDSIIGEATLRYQSAANEPSQLPAKNCVQIQYLNPSGLKRVACASRQTAKGYRDSDVAIIMMSLSGLVPRLVDAMIYATLDNFSWLHVQVTLLRL